MLESVNKLSAMLNSRKEPEGAYPKTRPALPLLDDLNN